MSTESGSRTTASESEPLAPAHEGTDAYTGRWSDWISGAAGPGRTGGREHHGTAGAGYDDKYREGYDDRYREGYDDRYREGYDDEYEAGEFDDEYDEFDDEDEYPGRARTEQATPRAAYDAAWRSVNDHGPGSTVRRPLKRTRPSSTRPRFGLSAERGGRQWAVPLLGLLAVLAVTAAVAVQIAKVTGGHPPAKPHVATPQAAPAATAPASPSTTDQPAAGLPANLCPNEAKGGNVRGNGPGSTKTGPDAILALQSRYYVDRSGKAVREMFAPDAPAPSIEQIQAGIDSIPVGTTYCVQIMPGPFDGQHIMVVTEQHPDATKRTWSPQLVITTRIGDATLISAIVPMNEDTPK
ncbi:hypothetical protein [Nocardia aurantiaca]|uniref:DUF8176 domain-containing protein n=1 Tax=Nocardia aurantiaca TaxID=2675850 RepID=A0A6I3L1N9_9NOCA|nr:hypothetical protein [Nocardia aurantiaca]MTE13769.1 hypothetical protein [Nocardia aurantiaca]